MRRLITVSVLAKPVRERASRVPRVTGYNIISKIPLKKIACVPVTKTSTLTCSTSQAVTRLVRTASSDELVEAIVSERRMRDRRTMRLTL